MVIIACLGNPGRKYTKSRHNIGFIIGRFLADKHGCAVNKKEFNSLSGRIKLNGSEHLLLFPKTYMNNSGRAVKAACGYYRVGPENLIVLHDEIEIPFGDVRLKTGGGHRGHNGLRSIMEHLGSPDFHRVRFGVGRPPNPDMAVADYVLSSFTAEEFDVIEERVPTVEELILSLIAGE